MDKKTLLTGFLTTLTLGGLLVSCHDETAGTIGKGVGLLSPVVDLDKSVNSSAANNRATDVTVNDLALTITSKDGSFSRSWASLADYDPTIQYPVGEYNLEATYGKIEDEGFDRPAYYGKANVTVFENKVSDVALTATLANSMVSIDYTDDFKNYMSSWSAELHSTGGAYLYYGPQETKPIYLKPGEVTLDLDITKPNGTSATLRVAKFNAKPRYHYSIHVDVENGSGTGVLTVTFDENLATEDVTIDLSDDFLNAPAPVVSSQQVENGGTVNYLEGSTPSKMAVDIAARGNIASVVVNTVSTSLLTQGWPAEFEVVDMQPNMVSRLSQLGFVQHGVATDAQRFGVLDFTDVQKSLREVDMDDINSFTVHVVDKSGKVSEPFTFNIAMEPLKLVLSNPSQLPVAVSALDVDLNYNGQDVAKEVKFEYQNERGTWEPCKVNSISKTDQTNMYRISLGVPATTEALTLRASIKNKTSNVLTVNRSGDVDFAIAAPENDVWSNHASVVLSSDMADAEVLASIATLYVSTDGVNYNQADVAAVSGNSLTLRGLTPGTSYYAKASVKNNESQSCEPVRFATETALAIPNGDFENTAVAYSATNEFQGGQWSISAGTPYQSKVTYTFKEATGWATTNAKTMSGQGKTPDEKHVDGSQYRNAIVPNTWFRQASVFATDMQYSSTVPKIRVIGTGGGTSTPAAFTGFTAHSGSNAMVLRNVAWETLGAVPSTWLKEFASTTDYYNHTVPAIANHSVAKMFLGTYSWDGTAETYTPGIEFTSRPAQLTGWYQYTPDSQDAADNGVVTVEVLNGSSVIGHGTANLAAATDYAKFNVTINYIANAPKATSIRVMVAASKYASDHMAEETRDVKVTTYNSRYEAYQHGATLVVDDFSLVY